METLNLYDTDFYAWTEEQARLLKNGSLNKLDIKHLFEEVEDMGKHEKRELANCLTVLLIHLLKWKYQPTRCGTSWELTIKEQRKQIKYHLEDNPSLRNLEHMNDTFLRSYGIATYEAAKQTKLSHKLFPEVCPFTIEEVLDDGFYPN